jgi:hypothetical protein
MTKDPFKTNGGNGGHSQRKPVTDKPNPQKKSGKKPYDYSGKDARRLGRKK